MNYKDTIMTHKEKQGFILERSHQQTVGEIQEDYLINKQAEISFRLGIEEALNWLSVFYDGTEYNGNQLIYSIPRDNRVKKLHEWGI
jgi:hypothetical protein